MSYIRYISLYRYIINMNNLQLKKRIMRRVYTIYAFRKVLSRTAFKVYAGLLLLYGIKVFVHVEAVANNMPQLSDLKGLYNFTTYALVHTGIAVQLIVFGVAGLAVWVMRDAIRKVVSNSHNAVRKRVHTH